ncbi:hypothetical protein CKO40_09400 [Halochromatium glycolicum]|uniref:Type I restriction enzyme, S subunit n=1 Tax=Halochromatium glycolicum TaxID=85075 RepID=A0AAJ0U3V5_9GAMM|nr:hypothetical protein [Halochromatium glycolicum]
MGGLCKAEVWPLGVGKVRERPSRMEAIYYGSDGYQALEALRNSHLETCRLGELTAVVWPGVFARRFVPDPERGVPFLSTSAMMEAKPKAKQFLSIKNTRNLSAYLVREGTILVSRSGTVGNVALVTKDLAGHAVSEDALRVHVRDPVDLGAVYCYLQSALGQFLLKRSQTGSVVRHLYEADVANLPIPKLPLELRRDLTERIRKVSALRVEANRLLDEAERMVQEQLGLPPTDTFMKNASSHEPATFAVGAMDRVIKKTEYGQVRLDATVHEPSVNALRKFLLAEGGMRLGDLLSDVRNSNLRKRLYVDDPENGVPLMGGKQITRIRPSDLKYLSSLHTRGLKNERVSEGWTLVTCGGTVGRTLLVHRNYNNWVMSQHVMRLIPNQAKVHPGFITGFLSSAYGQAQLDQMSYGSVQKELRDLHFRDVIVGLPTDRGFSIHETVVAAFDRRADALSIENDAFAAFISTLEEGSTESMRSVKTGGNSA